MKKLIVKLPNDYLKYVKERNADMAIQCILKHVGKAKVYKGIKCL